LGRRLTPAFDPPRDRSSQCPDKRMQSVAALDCADRKKLHRLPGDDRYLACLRDGRLGASLAATRTPLDRLVCERVVVMPFSQAAKSIAGSRPDDRRYSFYPRSVAIDLMNAIVPPSTRESQ